MSASAFRIHGAIPSAARTAIGTTLPAGTGDGTLPTLTTTVPKEFVHRAGVAEVLLTDWARVAEDHFAVAAQWPRGHSFFAAVDGCHDPLMAAETIRQTGLLLAHAEFGVPLDQHLLVENLDVSVRPEHIRVAPTPASLEVDVTCSRVTRSRGALSGYRISAKIHREGHLAATGGGSFKCVTPAVHQRLRAGRQQTAGRSPRPALPAPESPHNVGRLSPADVVLSPGGEDGRWRLRVDTRHPVLFDQPVDHVPGTVLLEAARQAAHATLGRATLALTLTGEFLRYVELDTPTTIEAHRAAPPRPDGAQGVQVTAWQERTPVFHSNVTLAPPTT